jgi:hypothetical protein
MDDFQVDGSPNLNSSSMIFPDQSRNTAVSLGQAQQELQKNHDR